MLVFGSNAAMDIDAYRRARLQELVDREAGGIVAEFARKHSEVVTATRLRQMLNPHYRDGGGFKEGAARKLEIALGLPKLYFDFGIETTLAQEHNSAVADISKNEQNSGMIVKLPSSGGSSLEQSNTRLGPDIRGKLPLISWVQAGTWESVVDNFAVGDAEDWLDCPVPHSSSSYCLHVVGDSMDDGTFEGYREGEIIFVDPEVVATPGDDVVVRTPDGKVTFKRLKRDEDGLYLFGLNGKKIIPLPEGSVFCGTVIFSGVRRGRRSGGN